MTEDNLEAQEKLDEALHFLLEMRQHYIDRKRFVYNLNAFLNAARNVTWSLQAQFRGKPDFDTWYAQKQVEMGNDKIFSFFNDLRVTSVHKKGTPLHKLSVKVAYIFPKDGKSFQATTIGYSERKLTNVDKVEIDKLGLILPSGEGSHQTIEPAYTLVTNWQFEKAPDGYEGTDILALCINYYHKIRKMMEEGKALLKIGTKQ